MFAAPNCPILAVIIGIVVWMVAWIKTPNKYRQINRRDVRSLGGFRRLGFIWFIHGLKCRIPAVSALLR